MDGCWNIRHRLYGGMSRVYANLGCQQLEQYVAVCSRDYSGD